MPAYPGQVLNILPDSIIDQRPAAHAEAVARLASIRHALRMVEPFGAGPAGDEVDDDSLSLAWPEAGEARQRHFDRQAEKLVSSTAAGMEALLGEMEAGRSPHEHASQALVDQIRAELKQVAGIILA